MIQLVLLDAVGTLFRARGSVGELYARVAREHGLAREAAAFDLAFRPAFRAMRPMAFPGEPPERIRALERAWWHELVGRVLDGVEAPARFDRERYFDAVFEVFASATGWQLYDDTLPALDALAARGVALGIVSNFDGRCRAVCEALGLAGYFTSLTLSSESGVAKPDPAIFAVALAEHGVRALHAAHVGDHPIHDAVASRAAGLRAFLLDRRRRPRGPGGVARLFSLTEIPAALDGTRP
ncbi:MAG: HAD-IA family hydrolase [Deltaproteobacteria bacterium]|nr:HAD-IA family hydrolase [Deltaproteobacteria bacterium]